VSQPPQWPSSLEMSTQISPQQRSDSFGPHEAPSGLPSHGPALPPAPPVPETLLEALAPPPEPAPPSLAPPSLEDPPPPAAPGPLEAALALELAGPLASGAKPCGVQSSIPTNPAHPVPKRLSATTPTHLSVMRPA